jgi:hypothetical protein
MKNIRWALVALILGSLVGIGLDVAAEAASVVYPPMGPCAYGFAFEYPADAVVAAYEACDITGVKDLTGVTIVCPADGMAFSVESWGCIFTGSGEVLNGNGTPTDNGGHQPWREGPRGHCTLADYAACQTWQGETTPGTVFAEIGVAYIFNTGGDDVNCRSTPDGDVVATYKEGDQVVEVADGIDDGWQAIQYNGSYCYISNVYLSNSAPSVGTPEDSQNDHGNTGTTPAGSTDSSTSASVSQTDNTGSVGGETVIMGTAQVTTLPSTGVHMAVLVSSPWPGIALMMATPIAITLAAVAFAIRRRKKLEALT